MNCTHRYRENNNKNGFTLVELIISIMISGIILVFLFTIVGNIVRDIHSSIQRSKILAELGELKNQINSYKNFYTQLTVLDLSGTTDGGPDILMMTDIGEQKGILFGIVDGEDLYPEKKYGLDITTKKLIGYREISDIEIDAIQANVEYIYSMEFQKENLLQDLVIQDIDLAIFNSGNILNMTLFVYAGYKEGFETLRYSEIGDEYIEKYNFNF